MRTEPLVNFTYTEEPDGTLRPDIQVNSQPEPQTTGQFGRAWKAWMQENQPQRVSEMLLEGTFHQTMQTVDEEAENHRENLIRSLLVQKPYPQWADTLERAAHLEMLTRTADEMTMAAIAHPPR